MLVIKDLHANVDGVEVLKGINLNIKKGEVHAIMGPNGSGKSTLSKVVSGHPDYEVTQGSVVYKDEDILSFDPSDRALKGIFMGFQYPVEIPGVNNEEFLKMALNAKRLYQGKDEISPEDFNKLLEEKLDLIKAGGKFKNRYLNVGLSGGEKKKNEILQLAILEPDLAILDETDSGLDIDALKVVANGIKEVISKDQSLILITHYQRLLDYIQPDYVHVLSDGKIIKSGDKTLAMKLEEQGYDWLVN
ncbi:MAG: Fe-S cluster assembly ATPase SufC [Planctomycetota bacterium]|nr:MAG: Fe-S cluster assembly ATPase SufC [Planctomycetota bacterium]